MRVDIAKINDSLIFFHAVEETYPYFDFPSALTYIRENTN